MRHNIIEVEEKLLILEEKIHIPVYDFNFELYYHCTHPSAQLTTNTAILRIGAIKNYQDMIELYREYSITLINTYEQHLLASELEYWYPLIKEYTPKSQCYEAFPEFDDLKEQFGLPVFIKGSRQTSQHNPRLSFISTHEQYERLKTEYRHDSILHWQKIAVREYIPLQSVQGKVANKLPCKYEFRTFWYKGICVGFGRYWYEAAPYPIPEYEKERALRLTERIAQCVPVPFLVIDIAKTEQDEWIVIECNDAQESGYAGVSPKMLWDHILHIESGEVIENRQFVSKPSERCSHIFS